MKLEPYLLTLLFIVTAGWLGHRWGYHRGRAEVLQRERDHLALRLAEREKGRERA